MRGQEAQRGRDPEEHRKNSGSGRSRTHLLVLLLDLRELLLDLLLLLFFDLFYPLACLQHLAETLFTLPVDRGQPWVLSPGPGGWQEPDRAIGRAHLQFHLLQPPSLVLFHLLPPQQFRLFLPPKVLQTLPLLLLQGKRHGDISELRGTQPDTGPQSLSCPMGVLRDPVMEVIW